MKATILLTLRIGEIMKLHLIKSNVINGSRKEFSAFCGLPLNSNRFNRTTNSKYFVIDFTETTCCNCLKVARLRGVSKRRFRR